MLQTLQRNERAIADYVHAAMAPYLPPGTKVERNVSFFFGDGADGWAVGTQIAAVVLEYYKDKYDRLVEVILHETFHTAQNVVRASAPPATRRTGADSVLVVALNSLLTEGTARFLAPGLSLTPAQAQAAAENGLQLIADLVASTASGINRDSVRQIMNKGVSGGGSFYALGGAMSQVIVDVLGAPALAETLRSDGANFARVFFAAADQARTPPAIRFPAELRARIERLPR